MSRKQSKFLFGGVLIVASVTKNIQLILDNCLCMNKERMFESIENARKFYELENYAAARAVRELAGDTDLILVEGLKGAL